MIFRSYFMPEREEDEEDIELLRDYIVRENKPMRITPFMKAKAKKGTALEAYLEGREKRAEPTIPLIPKEVEPVIPTESPETIDMLLNIIKGREAPPVVFKPTARPREEMWGILPSPKKMRRMEQIRKMKRDIASGILAAPGYKLEPGVYELENLLKRVEALKPSPIEDWMRQKAYETYLDLLKEKEKGKFELLKEEQRYLKEKMKQEEAYKRAKMIMDSKLTLEEKKQAFDKEKQEAEFRGDKKMAEFFADKKRELEEMQISAGKYAEKPEKPKTEYEKLKEKKAIIESSILDKMEKGGKFTPQEQWYFDTFMKKPDIEIIKRQYGFQ